MFDPNSLSQASEMDLTIWLGNFMTSGRPLMGRNPGESPTAHLLRWARQWSLMVEWDISGHYVDGSLEYLCCVLFNGFHVRGHQGKETTEDEAADCVAEDLIKTGVCVSLIVFSHSLERSKPANFAMPSVEPAVAPNAIHKTVPFREARPINRDFAPKHVKSTTDLTASTYMLGGVSSRDDYTAMHQWFGSNVVVDFAPIVKFGLGNETCAGRE
ncbi:hypothetical protein RhiLY_09590 [Ceratobasidium sp. AG-Ba]|nr:hypothetical protein RhiLY_09590 [Ceratobasidium sp. AG-Ba]